ncbi:hypothetical protein [Nocardia sp. NPDC003963]
METVTMVGLFDTTDNAERNTAGVNALLSGKPWFSPDPSIPVCGSVLHVPAAVTNDGLERRFVCDRAAEHGDKSHRQVTDADEGKVFEWKDGAVEQIHAAALAAENRAEG